MVADPILPGRRARTSAAPAGKPELDSIKLATFDWDKAAAEKGQLLDLYFKYFQSR